MPRKERLTKVIDGDTFMTASRKNPIRLANVDEPKKSAPGGSVATKALKDLIQGETVSIDAVARDIYARTVAKVKVGRQSVNKAGKADSSDSFDVKGTSVCPASPNSSATHQLRHCAPISSVPELPSP